MKGSTRKYVDRNVYYIQWNLYIYIYIYIYIYEGTLLLALIYEGFESSVKNLNDWTTYTCDVLVAMKVCVEPAILSFNELITEKWGTGDLQIL